MWTTPLLSYFRSPESEIPMTDVELSWVISVIEVGNFIGSFPAMYLVDTIGRRCLLLVSGPIMIISWICILLWPSVVILLIARIIQGISQSFVEIAGPIYLGEIASDSTRGAMTSLFSNFWWIGCLISYTLGPYLSYRTFTIVCLVFNVPFLLLFFFQPETPYFYAMTGNTEKTLKSLSYFRDLPEKMSGVEEVKMSLDKSSNTSSSIKDLFATPLDRKAFLILMLISYFKLATGSGGVTVYATEIFEASKNTDISPDNVTIIFGVVMLFGSLISSFTSDVWGRRPLLLLSTIGCLLSVVASGTYFFMLTDTDVYVSNYSWIAPVSIFLFSGFSTVGMYPVCAAYTSELFTSQTRGIASTAVSFMITFASFFVMVIFEPLKIAFGIYANFIFYAVNCLIAVICFYYLAPETKGKSFAQIRQEIS